MSKMSDLSISFNDLQMVLDSEREFQEDILPRLFSSDGHVGAVHVWNAIDFYVGALIKRNPGVYGYLAEALNHSPAERDVLAMYFKRHYETKMREGCYG